MNKNFGSLNQQFNLKLTQQDWAMFRSAASRRFAEKPTIRFKLFWLNLIVWFGIILVLTLFKKEIGGLHMPTIAVLCLLFVGFLFDILLIWSIQRNGLVPLKKGFFVGTHTFFFFENALIVENSTSKCIYSWKFIKSTKDDSENLFIFIDSYFGYILPKTKVENINKLEQDLFRLCK